MFEAHTPRESRSRSKVLTLRMTVEEYEALSEAAWRGRSSKNMFALIAVGRAVAEQLAAAEQNVKGNWSAADE